MPGAKVLKNYFLIFIILYKRKFILYYFTSMCDCVKTIKSYQIFSVQQNTFTHKIRHSDILFQHTTIQLSIKYSLVRIKT